MKINFTKMQALGNDFVFIDMTKKRITLNQRLVRQLCNRRFGIGADQLLTVEKSRQADFKMSIFNQDGGSVTMCGNGLRAIAALIRDTGLSKKKELAIETKSGIQVATFVGKNKIQIDMGPPELKGKLIPVNLNGRVINRPLKVDGRDFRITCVSMGNPHCVIFVDHLDKYPVENVGPVLETHNLFPQRMNIEFVELMDKKNVVVRTWERGARETLACGSGACAVAVAGVLNNYTDRKLTVKLRGGSLDIYWRLDNDHVYMTGPAEKVFEGTITV